VTAPTGGVSNGRRCALTETSDGSVTVVRIPGGKGHGDGVAAANGPQLEALAELTAASAKPPPAEVEAAHLAAMTQLARGVAVPGSAGGDAEVEAWRVLAEVAGLSTKPPDAEVEAAHLGAMGELARAIGSPPEPMPPPVIMTTKRSLAHRRLALGLVAPTLALPLCVATLAAAGVGLPGAIRAPLDSIGITSSRQAQPDELRAAIQGDPIRDPGCVFDQDVATALGFGRARLQGHLCERAAAGAAADHRASAANTEGGPAGHEGRHRVVLARLGEPPADAIPAGPLLANSNAGQASQGLVSAPSGGGSPPSGTGRPERPGGGHPAPSPGSGRPAPTPGGGRPSSPPVGPLPSPPPVALATRPGKGCGDKNHVHERADECK
jgi:hypothetical protein